MSALPKAVSDFLARTARKQTGRSSPAWLLSKITDPVWLVDTNAGDLRKVKGKQKGGQILRWDATFPDGSFASVEYATPTRQLKSLLIACVDEVCQGVAASVLSIYSIFYNLMLFAEHLAVKHGAHFRKEGLLVATLDDVEDFLEGLEEAGVAGCCLYSERWEAYLAKNCARGLEPIVGITAFLERNNAYARSGKICPRFVAQAIGTSHLRVARSKWMKAYLRAYDAKPSSPELTQMAMGSANNAANTLVRLSSAMQMQTAQFCGCELADYAGVATRCRRYVQPIVSRTKTMPLSVARNLLASACAWMTDKAPSFEAYISNVCRHAVELRSTCVELTAGQLIRRAEMSHKVPRPLEDLRDWWLARRPSSLGHSRIPLAFDATTIHVAVCFTIVSLMACARRSEIAELGSYGLRQTGDRFYLRIACRKRQMAGFRARMDKPVPKLVAECLKTMARVYDSVKLVFGDDDTLVKERFFFSISDRGVTSFSQNSVYRSLEFLVEYFRLEHKGQPWELAPHQLRRWFAMSFFHHSGAENALPALSWFMGHDDLLSTWRYIKEELSGREISEAEAAMATAAVYSADESDSVIRLRKVLLAHFGCEDMKVMDETDAQSYLEFLAEKGAFTVRPIQIASGLRSAVTVLISIKEERLNAALAER